MEFEADGMDAAGGAAFEVMQRELDDDEGGSTGLMSLRQTEYFDGQEKHLKFLESYPDVSIFKSATNEVSS